MIIIFILLSVYFTSQSTIFFLNMMERRCANIVSEDVR